MSTSVKTSSEVAATTSSSSAAFRTFVTVFAITTPIIYTICELRNWPLFTYHPGTNRVDWFWAASVRDEGPAMHWYGWICVTAAGGIVLGLLATRLPENVTRRIPLSLAWIVSLAMVPVLIYALRFFWRW
jgi:hypothetical protein